MANMSDLVTTDIGIIAFWNAHDHRDTPGVGDVNPEDASLLAYLDYYDVYDNGIEGYKALGSGRYFHVRVKTDGWLIAWIDRTNTFAYPDKPASDFGEAAHKGYYDILWDWFAHAANINSTYTTLSHLIKLMFDELDNTAQFTFAAADVGHYCYEYPDANVLTLLSKALSFSGAGTEEETGYVQYNNGTTIYHASAAAAASGKYSHVIKAMFAGNDILNYSLGSDGLRYGAADIKNWMPDPTTDYALYIYGNTGAGLGVTEVTAAILILWS